MQTYILRRLLYAVPAIVAATIIIFLIMRVLPGDPLTVMFGSEEVHARLTEADQQRIKESLGLDKPQYQQYLQWVKEIVTLDLGRSFFRNDNVRELLLRRAPISLEIAIIAVLFSWLVGMPAGLLSAARQNGGTDYITRFFASLFLAIPNFWLGAVIVLIAVLWFKWLPPRGVIYPWDDFWGNMQIVLLPGMVVGLAAAAYIARLIRSTVLEVVHEDYVRTARAKGLSEQAVMLRHALRNAVLPAITLSGVQLGTLLGGAVAVEKAFGVEGLGTLLVRAFAERDYAVIQNLVLLYVVIFVLINLLVDIAHAWIDPRIRLR